MSFAAAQHALTLSGERRLLLITGDADWCRQQARQLCDADGLWLGEPAITPHAVPVTRARQLLGQSWSRVCYDGRAGLHPDMLAAAGGLVQAGGILLLLLPTLADWPTFADPDYRRYLPGMDPEAEQCAPHFISRWQRLLPGAAGVWQLDQCCGWQGLDYPSPQDWWPAADAWGCRSPSQHDAVAAIWRCAQGHRHRPVVITADRGRGKSTALGIAAGALLRQATSGQRQRILLTAPARHSVQTLWQQALVSSGGEQRDDAIHCAHGVLQFYSPERLLAEQPPGELLLIDEAAALPVPQLLALCQHYSRIVFATTRHGYEGSGQGFALRVLQRLQTQYPATRTIELTTPLRWAASDPLEPLLSRLFLLDASCPPPPALQPGRWSTRWQPVAELLADEMALREVYGLLRLAHYQTSGSDLRLLLDSPSISLFRLEQEGRLIGLCLLNAEGGLRQELASAVWAGRRRARGHLLPQTLMAHAGHREAGGDRYQRILRIAVHPAVQGQGAGRALLAALHDALPAHTWLGVAFALDTRLLRFWLQAGFALVRLGQGTDSASGEVSAILLLARDADQRQQVASWQQACLAELPLLLLTSLHTLSAEVAVQLLSRLPPSRSPTPARILALADSQHPLEPAVPALHRWLLGQADRWLSLPAASSALLIRRVMQNWSWEAISQAGLIQGYKDGQRQIRQAIGQLIAYQPVE